MSQRVTIFVNDTPLEVDATKQLIEVLLENGISVPHFCYHEALGVAGNCRMCMVEIEGQKRPQIACDTPIKEGMRVSTQSDNIMQVKRSILELELINHPVDCPICDQAGECSLQDYYMEVGLYDSRIDMSKKIHQHKHVDLGSNVMLDQERCVLCARCTRFTSDVTDTHDLVIANRGNHACVTTFEGMPLEAKGYAMNVVDLCPVGALTSKDFRFQQRVWFLKSDASICHGCATGCNITIDHNAPKYEDDKIYRFRPRKNLQVNGHFICDTGRLSYHQLNENRLFQARINNEEFNIKELSKHIEAICKKDKPLIVASASLSLEVLMGLKLYAQAIDAELFVSKQEGIDQSFKDDMLKSSDRTANRASVKLLGINQLQEQLKDALLTAKLVLNFDSQAFFDYPVYEGQTVLHFSPFNHPNLENMIPLPAFSEQQGLIINHMGQLQCFNSTISHPVRVPHALEYLHTLHREIPETITEMRVRLRQEIPELSEIDLLDLPDTGIRLEMLE